MASIKQLANGRYQARYRDDGRREHAKNFRLKRDAQSWLDEQAAALVTGQYADPKAGRITFADFYRSWSARQVWVAGTVRNFDSMIKSATFADVPIGQIRRSHVEQWVKIMSGTLAPATVARRVKDARSVFRGAVRDRVIAVDPSEGVRLPRQRRAEHALTIPTPVQVGAILAAADDQFRPFVALCAFAGLRLGEASAVMVGDVDFLRRCLKVERQVQRVPGGTEVRAPKFGSERTVYLGDDLLAVLARHCETLRSPYLFAGESGEPMPPSTVGKLWDKTVLAAGLATRERTKTKTGKTKITTTREFTIHDLRHFYASGLIAAGCDVVTVQRALGHASATLTLGTYSHLWPTAEDRTRKAASALWSEVTGNSADSLRTDQV